MDGLKFKISSQELKSRMLERSSYHTIRAEEKKNSMPDPKKSLAAIKASGVQSVPSMVRSNYNMDASDPIADLERDIADHLAKAYAFRFFSEHLFDEDYTLREEDLVRLEITKRA